MSIVVKGGLVFLGSKFEKKDILIEDDRIVAIGTDLKAEKSLDASGMLVLPGLIDPHVHLREPGETYKEDFVTGSRAAIAGGFTTVIDMPNNKLPTITKARYDEKIELAKKAKCDILFHFGGTDDNFDEVKKTNPQSMKIYLGETTGRMFLLDPSSLEKHFALFPKDRPIVLHISDHSEDEEKNLAKTYDTLQKTLILAKKYDRRIHIAHVSTKKEMQIAAKYEKCTTEIAPHHLFLSTKDQKRLGPFAKVYPPLRSEQQRLMLWSVLEKVDCIATDHAPHPIEDKEAGAAGFAGLETSLALMLKGCNDDLLDKIWLVDRMSANVAHIFGLPKKGKIQKGNLADIILVDPKKEWTVVGSELETKCHWSPFDGMKLKGKVHTVIKSGKVVYEDYEFV